MKTRTFLVLTIMLFLIGISNSQSVEIGSETTEQGVVIVLPPPPTFNNNTAFVNASEIWVTNVGDLDNVNATQFKNGAGTLSILDGYVIGLFFNPFDQSLNTTDDVTFNNVTADFFIGNEGIFGEVQVDDININQNQITHTGQDFLQITSNTGLIDFDNDEIKTIGSISLEMDNSVFCLGSSLDSCLSYDGSDLIIDPDNVGSGSVIIGDGNLDDLEAHKIDANIFEIPTTQNTTYGVVNQNGARLMHSFGSINFFLGPGAGNFGVTGTGNLGFGDRSLDALTTGGANLCMGRLSGTNIQSSDNNFCLGVFSLLSLVSGGGRNVGVGTGSLQSLVDGTRNNCVGYQCLFNNLGDHNQGFGERVGFFNQEGNQNIFIGDRSGEGTSLHNKSGSIFIGHRSGENSHESNMLMIDNSNRADSLLYGNFSGRWLTINGDFNVTGDIDIGGDLNVTRNITAINITAENFFGNGAGLTGISTEKTWAISQVSGSGSHYLGGFYNLNSGDNDFNPSVNFGTANSAHASHFFIVTEGGDGAGDTTINVSGTSITDDGVRTASDFEVLTITQSEAAGSYHETSKKWLGQVTIVKLTGNDVQSNYGLAKYWDNNNNNFTVTGVEVTWTGGANDANPDILIRHHQESGWTYNVGSTPTPPTAIASMSNDYVTEIQVVNGENGAYKRSNLSTFVVGNNAEGTIVELVTTAGSGKTFEIGNFILRIQNE